MYVVLFASITINYTRRLVQGAIPYFHIAQSLLFLLLVRPYLSSRRHVHCSLYYLLYAFDSAILYVSSNNNNKKQKFVIFIVIIISISSCILSVVVIFICAFKPNRRKAIAGHRKNDRIFSLSSTEHTKWLNIEPFSDFITHLARISTQ